jgi:hypothetical protein
MTDALALLAGPLSVAVQGAAVAEIGAGAERLALRRKHDGPAATVLIKRIERAGDLVDERDVEEIVGRPPQLDEGDEAGFLDPDILERAHEGLFLLSRALCHSRGSCEAARCASSESARLTIKASTTATPCPFG